MGSRLRAGLLAPLALVALVGLVARAVERALSSW